MRKVWVVAVGSDYQGWSDWFLFEHQAEAFVQAKNQRRLINGIAEWPLIEEEGEFRWDYGGDHIHVYEQEIN